MAFDITILMLHFYTIYKIMLLAGDLLQILAACKRQRHRQCPTDHHKQCPIHHWQISPHDPRGYQTHQRVEGYQKDLDDRTAN